MNLSLNNQVALVTGASSGLGYACAEALAAAGASVVINYNSHAEPAEALAAQILQRGGRAITVGGDVSKEAEVENLFEKTLAEFGALDILVANSGLQQDSPIGEMTLAQWNKVLEVNLTGQFLCARAALRQFRTQGAGRNVSRAKGKIIHMSSVHQLIPWGGHVNYAASKGGVDMLMRSIAQEIGGDKIRVNSVAPGAIATPINASSRAGDGAEKILKLVPYGRIGEPEDVANAVVWLASDLSDYVHGTTLFVDGGMSLYPGFQDNG
jgi:glucose 1-dehydrogenase